MPQSLIGRCVFIPNPKLYGPFSTNTRLARNFVPASHAPEVGTEASAQRALSTEASAQRALRRRLNEHWGVGSNVDWKNWTSPSPRHQKEAGDVWCLRPVWNLRAVIWFHFAISSLVLLPSPVTFSVLSFSACWPFLLNFFQKILQYFSLRNKLFCMAPV